MHHKAPLKNHREIKSYETLMGRKTEVFAMTISALSMVNV